MADARGRVVRLNDRGEIEVQHERRYADASVVAAGAVELLAPLLDKTLAPVSARTVPRDGQVVGLVMVSEQGETGMRLRSGTGRGALASSAVADAVVRAVAPDGEVFGTAVERWAASGGVAAVSQERNGQRVAVHGDGDEVRRHTALAAVLPGPGRLAVDAAPVVHRVLRLPSASIAITTERAAPVLDDVDRWMALAEGAAAPFAPPAPYGGQLSVTNGKPALVVLVERVLGRPIEGLRFLPAPVWPGRT